MSEIEQLVSALREEVAYVIRAKGAVHANDAFDLAYHTGELLGMDVSALEREAQ